MEMTFSFKSFKFRRFATACLCWFAYLLLTLHEVIPHHHEEDVAHYHDHHGDKDRSHSHHTHNSHKHSEYKKDELNKECLLLIHHVTESENFVAPSIEKKKMTQWYPWKPPSYSFINYPAASSCFPHLSSALLQRATGSISLRGPPQA